jgi:hypothetical protein
MPRDRRTTRRFAGHSYRIEPGARVIRVGEVPGSNPGAPLETGPFDFSPLKSLKPERPTANVNRVIHGDLRRPAW